MCYKVKLLSSGSISTAEKAAIAAINCHSSAATAKFYEKTDGAQIAFSGKGVFAKIRNPRSNCGGRREESDGGEDDIETIMGTQMGEEDGDDSGCWALEEFPPSPSALPALQSGKGGRKGQGEKEKLCELPPNARFGENHPIAWDTSALKVCWTDEEVRFIKMWCITAAERNPGITQITAKCLKAILADPEARKLFHHRHVFNSSRLRVGYDKALQKVKPEKRKQPVDNDDESDEEEWEGDDEEEEEEGEKEDQHTSKSKRKKP